MAFTTVDLMEEWPGVVWPVPGDSGFRAASEFDQPTQGWLSYVYGVVRSRGNATRTLPARLPAHMHACLNTCLPGLMFENRK